MFTLAAQSRSMARSVSTVLTHLMPCQVTSLCRDMTRCLSCSVRRVAVRLVRVAARVRARETDDAEGRRHIRGRSQPDSVPLGLIRRGRRRLDTVGITDPGACPCSAACCTPRLPTQDVLLPRREAHEFGRYGRGLTRFRAQREHQPGRGRGVEHRLARGHGADGRDEAGSLDLLEDVAGCPGHDRVEEGLLDVHAPTTPLPPPTPARVLPLRPDRRPLLPHLKDFYDRKRAEGKSHKQAVLALARRRLDVLWALIRDQRNL